MSTHIPKGSAIFLIIGLALAAISFVFLNNRFGGPQLGVGEGYELRASFEDSQGLVSKSYVMVNGVIVGDVAEVERVGNRADVRFTIKDRYAPINRGASARIGLRTLFGEPFIDLTPGDPKAGRLPRLAEVGTGPTVDYDEALDILNPPGRKSLIRYIRTLGRAARSPQAVERTNATYAGLSRTVRRLRVLSDELRGQEGNIAGFVTEGRRALGQLSDREESLRTIVASGRTTLEGLASQRTGLEAGFVELPKLLDTGRRVLAEARPLVREMRPFVADLGRAGPDLSAGLRDLPAVARGARGVVDRLPALNRAAGPTLGLAGPLIERARPFAQELTPALANLVPIARYLGPRASSFSAFFANTASMSSQGDSSPRGRWIRFFYNGDPFGVASSQSPDARCVEKERDTEARNSGFCHNSYPEPGDAAHNEPFEPGSYPRLMPLLPRPHRSPKEG